MPRTLTTVPGLSALHGIPRLLPGLNAPLDNLDVGESLLHKALGQTGRSVLVGSGAIEDEFLIRFQMGQSPADFGPAFSALQKDALTFAAVAIGAYEPCSPGQGLFPRLLWRNPGYFAHGNPLLNDVLHFFPINGRHTIPMIQKSSTYNKTHD